MFNNSNILKLLSIFLLFIKYRLKNLIFAYVITSLNMKKFIYILGLAALLTSCDDGDLVLENLNFNNVSITRCTNQPLPTGKLFKINGSELLLINIPYTLFNNTTSTTTQPKIHTLSLNEAFYRKYNGTINNNVICSDIPPASPTVQNEWVAAPGGTIEVITTEKFTLNPTTNISELTGYSHVIRFKNVQFSNGTNAMVYDDYLFGEYITNL